MYAHRRHKVQVGHTCECCFNEQPLLAVLQAYDMLWLYDRTHLALQLLAWLYTDPFVSWRWQPT